MTSNLLNALFSQNTQFPVLQKGKGRRIAVALSGGVDSSVAALLLKEAGYDVQAIFMKNWEEDDTLERCTAQEDLDDARAVANQLGIGFHAVNFSAEYWEDVFQKFLKELSLFRTPNPDVLCNKWVKFEPCLKYARSLLNCELFATGHYARIDHSTGAARLLKGLDAQKDQSYFLHALSAEQIQQTVFPIGDLKKKMVRAIAKEYDLPTASKKDSTGICFIGPKKFSNFLSRYLSNNPGPIVDTSGMLLGEHMGLAYYTIGQRKGLHLSQKAEYSGQAWYVLRKEAAANRLVVTKDRADPDLWTTFFRATEAHWIDGPPSDLLVEGGRLRCHVKVRYHQDDVACEVRLVGDHIEITLAAPVRACTPGQYAVFYQGHHVLGGACIRD